MLTKTSIPFIFTQDGITELKVFDASALCKALFQPTFKEIFKAKKFFDCKYLK
jgi:hypothetical protein